METVTKQIQRYRFKICKTLRKEEVDRVKTRGIMGDKWSKYYKEILVDAEDEQHMKRMILM
jgi:hypothetical protein